MLHCIVLYYIDAYCANCGKICIWWCSMMDEFRVAYLQFCQTADAYKTAALDSLRQVLLAAQAEKLSTAEAAHQQALSEVRAERDAPRSNSARLGEGHPCGQTAMRLEQLQHEWQLLRSEVAAGNAKNSLVQQQQPHPVDNADSRSDVLCHTQYMQRRQVPQSWG